MPPREEWIFRNPDVDPLHIFFQLKVFSIVDISNSRQTFTVRVSEEVAVWLTRNDMEHYQNLQDDHKAHEFRPSFFVDPYAYDAVDIHWQAPLQTPNGCIYHIRPIRTAGGNTTTTTAKCCAWRQRMGRLTFNQAFDLHDFPLDAQRLEMLFQFFHYTNDPHTQVFQAEDTVIRPMYHGTAFARTLSPRRGSIVW